MKEELASNDQEESSCDSTIRSFWDEQVKMFFTLINFFSFIKITKI